ncbi:MAG TPA: hypothetical protein VIH00_12310, partial [Candidatus Limnocylindrales bacterium]
MLEATGLDRMLGSRNADRLYGGTEVSFLFGNGGDDQLFRVDGSLYESADGGLSGDDWKDFALESGRVWYVAGSEADDVITVDFVNEPGLLGDHHLVTRLTDNNGVFSFAASVNLDFNATDESGNPLWDGADVLLNIQQLQQRGAAQDPDNPDASVATTDVSLDIIGLNQGAVLEGLLPAEGDFDVILIDALGGDDFVSVGPTVQKTVWIDAGFGNDRVVIAGGKVVLADRAEFLEMRNDTAENAYLLDSSLSSSGSYTGLTIDNPEDVDWFRFALENAPGEGARVILDSESSLDGLDLGLYQVLKLTDVPGTQAAGYALGTYGDDPLVTGPSVAAGEEDWFNFELTQGGELGDIITLKPQALWYSPSLDQVEPVTSASPPELGDVDDWSLLELLLDLVAGDGSVIKSAVGNASQPALLSLAGQLAGTYSLRVSGAATTTPYEMSFRRAQSASVAAGALQIGRDLTDLGEAHDTIETAYGLPAVQSLGQVTGLTLHDLNDVDLFRITLDRDGVSGDRINLVKNAAADEFDIALLDADGIEVGERLIDTPELLEVISLEDVAGGTYYLQVKRAVAQTDPARYDLVFQVPELRQTESTYSDEPNGSRETALYLGPHFLFPQVTGSVLENGAQKWYSFDLQRSGGVGDVIRLQTSPGPIALAVVYYDASDVEHQVGSAVVDSEGVAEISLNGQAGDRTYFIKVSGALVDTPFTLSPGDKPSQREIVETDDASGLSRQEIRTIRDQADTQIDLSGRQTTFLELSPETVTAGKEYLLRVSSPNRVPTIYNLTFDIGAATTGAADLNVAK